MTHMTPLEHHAALRELDRAVAAARRRRVLRPPPATRWVGAAFCLGALILLL